jgi:VanZ family protein
LNPAQKQLLKTWTAAILWLGLIAVESTNYLSAANTSRILYPIFHFFTGVDPVRFEVWDYYIRKIGHFVGYFGLSWLLFRAWRLTLSLPEMPDWSLRWAAIAFVMSAFVAALDEWHQTHLISRTGTLRDVLLDSSAALAAQIAIFFWSRSPRPGRRHPSLSSSGGSFRAHSHE